MSQLLFRNRWFALIWAIAICFSISRFFDEGGGQQQLAKAATDIRNQRVAKAQHEEAMRQDMEESQVVRGSEVSSDANSDMAGDRPNDTGPAVSGSSENSE